jgi:hypothetical protein
VQNSEFEKAKETFFGVKDCTITKPPPEESYDDALKVFYGIEEPKNQAPKIGVPIPGYSGVNRRV